MSEKDSEKTKSRKRLREYRREYRRSKVRIEVLQQAIQQGHPLDKQLQEEQQKLSELVKNYPKGDLSTFIALCIICALALVCPVWFYVTELKNTSAYAWLYFDKIVDTPIYGVSIVIIVTMVLIALWYVQKRMLQERARMLLQSLIVVVILLWCFILAFAFRLLMFPLIMN